MKEHSENNYIANLEKQISKNCTNEKEKVKAYLDYLKDNVEYCMVKPSIASKTEKYTGRTMEKKVTFVLKTKDVKYWPKEDIEKYGFQIISFK